MNGICGGTTHPRMTTAPRLILGAMARAVTTAELNTLLMLRRIAFSLAAVPRREIDRAGPIRVHLCAAPPKRLSDPDLGTNQRNRERYRFR